MIFNGGIQCFRCLYFWWGSFVVLESCLVIKCWAFRRKLIHITSTGCCVVFTCPEVMRCHRLIFKLFHGVYWSASLCSWAAFPYYCLHIFMYFDHAIICILIDMHNGMIMIRICFALTKSVHDIAFLLLTVMLTQTHVPTSTGDIIITLRLWIYKLTLVVSWFFLLLFLIFIQYLNRWFLYLHHWIYRFLLWWYQCKWIYWCLLTWAHSQSTSWSCCLVTNCWLIEGLQIFWMWTYLEHRIVDQIILHQVILSSVNDILHWFCLFGTSKARRIGSV